MSGASTWGRVCVCSHLARKRGQGEPRKHESQDGSVCENSYTRHKQEGVSKPTTTTHCFASTSVSKPPKFTSTLLVRWGWC